MGEEYSYLIDSRLNVFRSDNDRWAIVIERLGYNPRAGFITIDLYHYGNCLDETNLVQDQSTNCYPIYPIDFDSFESTIQDECLLSDAKDWIVRGKPVPLYHEVKTYTAAGIEITELGRVRIEEAARLSILEYRELFRATDDELFKYLPGDLKKILVIDEWFHKDFRMAKNELLPNARLREIFDFNEKLEGVGGLSFDDFANLAKQQMLGDERRNNLEWKTNRPGSYETWQLIADALVSGDTEKYKPELSPNSSWKFWPESGSL